MMDKLVRVLAGLLLIPAFYAAYIVTMTADAQTTTSTTLPACMPMPVVIDSHRCIHVVKGTPHFDPGTPVEVIVQEDRR